MMASMMGLLLLAFRPLAPAFDMGPVSAQLARLEAQGRPIANLGKYHGQFHFAGRLQHPIDALHSTQEVHNWIGRNPQGVLIRYFPRDADLNAMPHLFAQPYRSGWVALVMANEAEVADEAGDRPNQGAAANDADE
jgi:hypothetical protein